MAHLLGGNGAFGLQRQRHSVVVASGAEASGRNRIVIRHVRGWRLCRLRQGHRM